MLATLQRGVTFPCVKRHLFEPDGVDASAITAGGYRMIRGLRTRRRASASAETLATAIGLSLLACGTAARADIVQADDVIIDGSLCVGGECTDGLNFLSSTVRLKDGIVRIDFEDTTTQTFPVRDWRLEANASTAASAHFAIRDMGDATAWAEGTGTPILMLRAGAPANSLYVSPEGRVGFGTATPAQKLHVVSGLQPALRLEQDGSLGELPGIVELIVNAKGLFVQNLTEGGTTPLSIRSEAPDDALVISDRIGMQTGEPEAPLDIRASVENVGVGNSVLRLVNADGPTAFQLHPFGTSFFWNFAAADNDTFRVNRSGNGVVEMSLNGSGNLTIAGTLTTGGPSCSTGCDAVFDADYRLPSIEEHAEAMWAKKHLPNVGPTLPNQPVNISEQYGRMLNELETAHIYIEQLHRDKAELRAELEAQRVANEIRFARLETAISGKLVE
jgi:hypothetical protein